MASRKDDTPRILRAASAKLKQEEGLVRAVWEGVLQALAEDLALHGKVDLHALGRLAFQDRKPRVTKNPRTGRIQLIAPGRTFRMSPSRGFKELTEKKLSVVLGVGGDPAVQGALRSLEASAYTVLSAPGFPEALQLLATRPVSVVLTSPASPEALFGFTFKAKGLPLNRMARVLAPALPSGAPLPGLRILPEHWTPAGASAADLAQSVEQELSRLADERGYFSQHFSAEMASDSEAVRAFVLFLEDCLGDVPFEEDERHKLAAALREAIENALRHGNQRDPSKRLYAEFLVDSRQVTFWVRDEGPGFDYESYLKSAPVGTALEVARENIQRGKTGGLGIRLLTQCVDEVTYTPPGNRVTLTKSLPGPASGI